MGDPRPDDEAAQPRSLNQAAHMRPDDEAAQRRSLNQAAHMCPDDEAAQPRSLNQAAHMCPDDEAVQPRSLNQAAHAHEVRVYYEDTDAGGIVYHATYLRWAERARTESLRELGLPHADMATQHGAILVVKRIEVEYATPARLDDLVTVRTRIRRVSAILDLDQDVLLDGTLLAALKVRLVCVSATTLRPRAIPEPWRSVLRARIAAPEMDA